MRGQKLDQLHVGVQEEELKQLLVVPGVDLEHLEHLLQLPEEGGEVGQQVAYTDHVVWVGQVCRLKMPIVEQHHDAA